jgi:Holliday junction resolvasome RuvABC DNA-binding subunit
MKKTIKELAEKLTVETINISEMYMKIHDLKKMDKQNWAFMHLGYISALRHLGYSEEDCDCVISQAQTLLEKETKKKK